MGRLREGDGVHRPASYGRLGRPQRALRKAKKSLFRAQYNALGKRNLSAIERIVTSKYQRGAAFNRQHPFVDVLLSDITECGEVLDVSELRKT